VLIANSIVIHIAIVTSEHSFVSCVLYTSFKSSLQNVDVGANAEGAKNLLVKVYGSFSMVYETSIQVFWKTGNEAYSQGLNLARLQRWKRSQDLVRADIKCQSNILFEPYF
jgi:hypothetical protein